jgi:hypothetical protein
MGYNFMAGPGGQAQQRGEQRRGYESNLNDLMRQIQFGQIQGMDPMKMAGLQQQYGQAQQGFGDWQNQQYANQMAQMSRPGSRGVGSSSQRPGPSQLQMNPFLEMLLMSQLGMNRGGGAGPQMG